METNIIGAIINIKKSEYKRYILYKILSIKTQLYGEHDDFKCLGFFIDQKNPKYAWDYMSILCDTEIYKIINISTELLFIDIL